MRYFIGIFIFFFISCNSYVHIADIKHRKYQISAASYPVHTGIAAMIEPYKLGLDSVMNVVIGHNETELTKGKPSSSLTNWFTDALHEATQKLIADPIDFTIQNYGGIRIPSLAKGNVTVGSIYELMPFDNMMVIVPMLGSDCQKLFDKFAESGGWPVSSGVKFKIHYGKATDITIGNQPLDTTRSYIVAMPDYVASGGDNYTFLKDLPQNNTKALVRDLLIDHVRRNKRLIADNSPRITE